MKATTLVAIAAFAFVAACASAPKRVAQLDEARVKVEALSQDPLAQQAASRELAQRAQILTRRKRHSRRVNLRHRLLTSPTSPAATRRSARPASLRLNLAMK